MEVEEDEWPEEIKNASPEDLMTRVRMLDNDIRVSRDLLLEKLCEASQARLAADSVQIANNDAITFC